MDVGATFREKWENIKIRHLKHANTLYMNEGMMEILRWNLRKCPLEEFWDCGLYDLRLLEKDEKNHSGNFGTKAVDSKLNQETRDQLKWVIWLTGDLHEYNRRIEEIIGNESTKTKTLEVVVLTNIHERVYGEITSNVFSSYDDANPFRRLEQAWLGSISRRYPGKNIKILVESYPWNVIELFQNVLIIPGRSQFFPSLNKIMTPPTRLKDFSPGQRRDLQILMGDLWYLCDHSGMEGEIYTLGSTAFLGGKQIDDYIQKAAESHASKCKIILIDRIMDLTGPLLHSSNALDILYKYIESGHVVDRPLKLGYFEPLVLKDQEEEDFEYLDKIYPNSYWSYDRELFEKLSSSDHREALVILRERLLELLHSEDISCSMSKNFGKATINQLIQICKLIVAKPNLVEKYHPLIGFVTMVLYVYETKRLSEWEKFAQVEKSLLKTIYDCISNETVPGDDSVRVSAAVSGMFIQLIRSLSSKNSDISDSSEIIALLLIVYSLLGEDLTEFHVEASIKEELTRTIRSSGNENIDRNRLIERLDAVFDQCRNLAHVRDKCKGLNHLIGLHRNHERVYRPFLSLVLEHLLGEISDEFLENFDQISMPNLIDAYLTNIGRLLKPVSHQQDSQVILLFVIGGTTFHEINDFRNTVTSLNPTSKIILVSNTISTPSDMLSSLLRPD